MSMLAKRTPQRLHSHRLTVHLHHSTQPSPTHTTWRPLADEQETERTTWEEPPDTSRHTGMHTHLNTRAQHARMLTARVNCEWDPPIQSPKPTCSRKSFNMMLPLAAIYDTSHSHLYRILTFHYFPSVVEAKSFLLNLCLLPLLDSPGLQLQSEALQHIAHTLSLPPRFLLKTEAPWIPDSAGDKEH